MKENNYNNILMTENKNLLKRTIFIVPKVNIFDNSK